MEHRAVGQRAISLDFIVVFLFGFLFLHQWDQRNIHSFIAFFGLCFLYSALDRAIARTHDEEKTARLLRAKSVLLLTTIGTLVFSTLVLDIAHRARHQNARAFDGLMLSELAVGSMVAGENPYAADYSDTAMARVRYMRTTQGQVLPNPTLTHLPYPPGSLLMAIPLHLLFEQMFGFYDGRILHLILFTITLLVLLSLPKRKEDGLVLTAFFALNPLFLLYFVVGRNDILVLCFIVLALRCLQRDSVRSSSIHLALACSSKHSALLLLPFYYTFLYLHARREASARAALRAVIASTWPLPAIVLAVMIPFLAWSPADFFDDLYGYLAGTSPTSYPINGFGISVWLVSLGLVSSITDYVPFGVVQLPLLVLLFLLLQRRQRVDNSLSRMIANYGIASLLFWFLSRFFHDNYVGFASQLFLLAWYL